jgi:hypothetical protein
MFCKKKCCCYSKLSGFFAFPALVHFVRLFYTWEMSIGETALTWNCSLSIAIIAGVISGGLCWMSRRDPCCNPEKDE